MRVRNLDMSFDVNIDFEYHELDHEGWTLEEVAQSRIESECREQFEGIPNSFTVGIVDVSRYGDDVTVSAVVKA